MLRIARILACLAICTACGGDAPESRQGENTVDRTGAFPVISARSPMARWTVALHAEIGSEPDGGSAFGGVRSVAVSPSGLVAVLDHRTPQILAFSGDGEPAGSWGRTGSGPGEYRRPYSIAFLGDSLLLFDPNLSRITLYDHNRAWLREWTATPNTGSGFVRFYPNPPATAWIWATRTIPTGLEPVFVRYDAAGPSDTLVVPSYTAPSAAPVRCDSPDGGISFFTAPLSPTLLSAPLEGNERVVALTSAYRLAFLSPTGDTTRIIERQLNPLPVSDSIWTAATEEWTEFRRRIPTAQCSKESFERPTSMPLLHGLFADDRGRLWVEAHGVDGVRYDIFTPNGDFVASVEGLPATDGTTPSVSGDRIVLVVADSLGVQRVQVYKLQGAS